MFKFTHRAACVFAACALGASCCLAASGLVPGNTDASNGLGANLTVNGAVNNFGNGAGNFLGSFTINLGANLNVTVPSPTGSQIPGILDAPLILSVRGRLVKVQVPPGYKTISLQRKTVRRSLPWAPVATQNCDQAVGEVTFRLRAPLPKRLLRVIGSRDVTPVPSNGDAKRLSTFFADASGGSSASAGGINGSENSGMLSLSGNAVGVADSSASNSLSLASGASVADVSRDVVESDIWKLQGDRLYVFNPYRGLQVLDVSNPAQPGLLGTLQLPLAGDQLYVLDENHVALLAHAPESFLWKTSLTTGQTCSVMICEVSTGVPKPVATLAVPGDVMESRLVGTSLYVAAQVYPDYGVGGGPQIQVTGFDLSDPAHPVKRNTVSLTTGATTYSYFETVQSSDHYFLVAANVWTYDPVTSQSDYRTQLGVVDITAANATVALRGNIRVDGSVTDKFNLREQGGVVSVVSNHWWWAANGEQQHAHLENFSLANPDQPKSLGELDLGDNESVQATRFDGDRAYVVTYHQVDPLWIVDNSNPKAPKVAGHVQVPGYSTLIEPLGDRLVTLGFVDNQITVSLFDVSDATDPKVIQQLPVSQNWAWSEANWNDKAFSVLPDQGLIMLPLTEAWYWNWDDSTAPVPPNNGIQLVDFTRDSLTLRGRIAQAFAPRRAMVHRDAVLALGDAALLTADITDRDQPQIVSDVALATRTDFVWPVGKYVIEVGGSLSGGENTVGVALADNPDVLLSSISLGSDPVLGADFRDGYVYILQRSLLPKGTTDSSTTLPVSAGRLSIYNADSAPVLVKTGEAMLPDPLGRLGYATKFFWPVPGTLVIGASGNYYPYFPVYAANGVQPLEIGTTNDLTIHADSATTGVVSSGGLVNVSLGQPIRIPSFIAYYPYFYGWNRKSFFAVDVTDPKNPSYLGTQTVQPKWYASFSDVHCAGGKLFFTYQYSWPFNFYGFTENAATDDATAGEDEVMHLEGDGDATKYYGRYFLQVLDYTTPTKPVVSDALSAPGSLCDVASDGSVLYMSGPLYNAKGYPEHTIYGVIQVAIYDGKSVGLAATSGVGDYHDLVAVGSRLFASGFSLGSREATVYSTNLFQFDGASALTLLDSVPQQYSSPAVFGQILLGWTYDNGGYGLDALDFSDPAHLRQIGEYSTGSLLANPQSATGNATDGFWFPEGDYGVLHVELPK